ncbi:BolA/IbaG family iron-sulfur metabolism protein [Moraxella canis]|uniref:BolA/IbaG family iron-sulfur metabolism protein n=1 Tax=Moraxella canis TaxID=90239 RepID=A0ABZ0X0L9_9GAMM|nr:BolA/IbaG family iron-sulfur metabolism protein [Moraxella canis]WQE04778.1 BolA/IbaG family iron-sulfur metabolism protein [Moraxella canis]
MNAQALIELLRPHFTDAHIDAVNEGNKFELLIVDDAFEGKRLVARQQMIYALVNEHIQSGAMHALTIHALTPAEYAAKKA